jgi:hypothetical protein
MEITMSTLRPALSAAVILAACAAGCSGLSSSLGIADPFDGKTGSEGLVPQPHPRLDDLPVPIGFRLAESRSRDFQAGGARYVDHLYKGTSDRLAVKRFYKRYMPENHWVFVTDIFVQGGTSVDFEKGLERCRVTISRGSLFHPTYIKLAIWTTGRTAPASDSKGGGSK